MTDKQLFDLCQKYGAEALRWRRKFVFLLPEVEKRKLWKKKGYYSIYDFAARLGGVTKRIVDEVLRLDKKLEEKPLLKAQIEKQGWSKVSIAARIPVKEEEAIKMVETLPRKTLEVYAKEVTTGCNSQPEKLPKLSFTVKPETELRLRKFRQELEKERKESITLGEALEELLNQIEQPKTRKSNPSKEGQRYITASDRRKAGDKCAMCKQPATEIHHPDRFATTKAHKRLVPLCHHHHQIAHAGLIENEQDDSKDWRLRDKMKPNAIDKKYLKRLNLKL
ncbi:MAG: hypothetical protein ABII07_01125 [Patescibacteria group bacterium]|nr:hypothetical protein [Patescibacteria group bacterium]